MAKQKSGHNGQSGKFKDYVDDTPSKATGELTLTASI
jgi:hypothetical protein